jgi:hypothetical protein
MRFWSGTTFMKTSEAIAVARLLDEAGYDGIVTSDHMIYPRERASPYSDSPTGKPMWTPETAAVRRTSASRQRADRPVRRNDHREGALTAIPATISP